MDGGESLSHSRWECKYHVVFIPKCRRKSLYEQLRPHLGEVFRKLAQYKESSVEEGHLMQDHVHMLYRSRRNIRYRRWWGISKARVRSI
jgi:putative transposase